MRPFMALLRFEAEKLARMKRIYLAPLGMMLWTALFTWGFLHVRKPRSAGVAALMGLDLNELLNGYLFARIGLELGVFLLLPLFVCLVAGGQMAGEAHDGTLRTVLTRPVPRLRLLAAKFAVTGAYVLAVSVFLVALLLGVGLWLRGPGSLLAGAGWERIFTELELLPASACPMRFAAAALLLTAAFLEVAACAFLFSCLTRHTSAAIIGTLMLYLLCVIMGTAPPLQDMDFFRSIRPWLPTRPMEVWKQVFEPGIPWARVARDLTQIGAYTATFLAAAAAATDARDVTD